MATDSIDALLKLFTTAKHLNSDNMRLETEFHILAALVTSPLFALNFSRIRLHYCTSTLKAKVPLRVLSPDRFSQENLRQNITCREVVQTKLVRFVFDELLSADNYREKKFDMQTISAGLKALSAFYVAEEEWKQIQPKLDQWIGEGRADIAKDDAERSVSTTSGPSEHFQELVQILFECIESEGEKLADISVPESDQAVRNSFYWNATSCAMSMIKLRAFASLISPNHWHLLCWSLLNPSLPKRTALLNIYSSIIQTYPVHSKFLAYACILANDEALNATADRALNVAVHRLRTTHEDLCAALIKDESESLRRTADHYIPESILPYVLHLLSYHPDFPTSPTCESEGDKRRMKAIVRCVRMLLTALQSSLRNESSNISFLLKQLNLITHFYGDRLDQDNIGINFVAELTRKLILDQIKTADNVQVYPGDINIPSDLFKLDESGTSPGLKEFDTNIVSNPLGKDTQQMIDKIVTKTGKAKSKPTSKSQPLPLFMSPPLVKPVSKRVVHRSGGGSSTGKSSDNESPRKRSSPFSPNSSQHEMTLDDDILSDDNSDQSEEARSKKKKRKMPGKGSSKKIVRPVEEVVEEVKSRTLPSRRAKEGVTSYKEEEVTEREVNSWEESLSGSRRGSSDAGDLPAVGGKKISSARQSLAAAAASSHSIFTSPKAVPKYSISDLDSPQKDEDRGDPPGRGLAKSDRQSARGGGGSIGEDPEAFVAFDHVRAEDSAAWASLLEEENRDSSRRSNSASGGTSNGKVQRKISEEASSQSPSKKRRIEVKASSYLFRYTLVTALFQGQAREV